MAFKPGFYRIRVAKIKLCDYDMGRPDKGMIGAIFFHVNTPQKYTVFL